MQQLEKNLIEIYRALLNREFIAKQVGKSCHPEYELSAKNLVRYLTVRSMDLRKVHDHLSELGISSLRSCEAYVWTNVSTVLSLVKLLNGETWSADPSIPAVGYKQSKKLVKKHASKLFNISKRTKQPRIMVTMPSEAASDPELVGNLIDKGMEIARINLSHDSPPVWRAIMDRVKLESELRNTECKIYMDLSGPKIRTGKIAIQEKKKKQGITKDFIRLFKGDHLVLHDDPKIAGECLRGKRGELLEEAHIGVSLPSILKDIRVGDRIMFDDGKIKSEVISVKKNRVTTIIKGSSRKGLKLKSEKGINLPDTILDLPSLTKNDIANIPLVCESADLVGYSFVREASDVTKLQNLLAKHKRTDIGIILKIENKEAFENLPLILLEAMKWPRIGVMIARGDLAVEIGPERIAEVQDQILWLCEAAHIPVIWATEVLNNLAKTGKVTRAEITDAAKSSRAECVMLNKGPYILDAVDMLGDILVRMNHHNSKKKSIMRSLKVAKGNIDKLGEIVQGSNLSTQS